MIDILNIKQKLEREKNEVEWHDQVMLRTLLNLRMRESVGYNRLTYADFVQFFPLVPFLVE